MQVQTRNSSFSSTIPLIYIHTVVRSDENWFTVENTSFISAFYPRVQGLAALCASSLEYCRSADPLPSQTRPEGSDYFSRCGDIGLASSCLFILPCWPVPSHCAFVPLVRTRCLSQAPCRAMHPCHLEPGKWTERKWHLRLFSARPPLRKCTVSSVPKLGTVLQVIKHGISFYPQRHDSAHARDATSGMHFPLTRSSSAVLVHF